MSKNLTCMIELPKGNFAELFRRIELSCSSVIYVTNTIIYKYEEAKRNLTCLCVFRTPSVYLTSAIFHFFLLTLRKTTDVSS